jgi:hypothetical protein
MGNLPWQVRTWHELTCVVLIEYEEAEITDSLGPYIEADLCAIGEMDRKLDWRVFLGGAPCSGPKPQIQHIFVEP